MSASEAATVLKSFCQQMGAKQEFKWSKENSPNEMWEVVLTVPGVPFEAKAEASSKQLAHDQVIINFLSLLERNGALAFMGLSSFVPACEDVSDGAGDASKSQPGNSLADAMLPPPRPVVADVLGANFLEAATAPALPKSGAQPKSGGIQPPAASAPAQPGMVGSETGTPPPAAATALAQPGVDGSALGATRPADAAAPAQPPLAENEAGATPSADAAPPAHPGMAGDATGATQHEELAGMAWDPAADLAYAAKPGQVWEAGGATLRAEAAVWSAMGGCQPVRRTMPADYPEGQPVFKRQRMLGSSTGPTWSPKGGGAAFADACYQEMLRLVRQAMLDDAYLICNRMEGMPGCLSPRLYATILSNISVRSPRAATMALLDTVHSLNLVPFPDAASQAYFARHSKWLVGDLLADGEATVTRAQTVPADVLEVRGECVACLEAGRGKGTSDLALTGKVPWTHEFQKGDAVLVTCLGTGLEVGDSRGTCEAECLSITSNGMTVKVMGLSFKELEVVLHKQVRVDKASNRVTFNRQLDALRQAVHFSGDFAWLRVPLFGEEEDLNLYEDRESEAKVAKSLRDNASSSLLLSKLNFSQQAAIAACLARRLTLIQGPPGTGKTHTACKLVELLVATGISPILLTADSNIAVDNLTGCVANSKIKLVRIGRPESTRPDLERYNLERQAFGGELGTGQQKNWGELTRTLSRAEVVCATCSGAAHPLVQDLTFRCIILDEATQATEASSLVPILRLHQEGVIVLIGDQQQLGPTVVCQEALEEGLGMSLFERLVSRGLRTLLLDTQYRMHPAIADFPSRYYYDCQLRTGICGRDRPALPAFPWPAPAAPVVFVPTQGSEMMDGTSYYNPAEAENVLALLQMLADSHGITSANDIGIISPYSAHVRLLKKRVCAAPPYKQPGTGRVIAIAEIEVNSVDGFQGREKEIIMLSTVRCNASGSVGFLTDPRRLNVAITRARRGLIICGHTDTLSKDRGCWGGWLNWAMERGLLSGVQATDPSRAMALQQLHGLTVNELAVTEPT